MKQVLRSFPGNVPVMLWVFQADGSKVFIEADRAYRVNPTQQFVHDMEKRLGEDSVFVQVNPQPCLRGHGRDTGRRRSPVGDR
jgi:hypothetical protein